MRRPSKKRMDHAAVTLIRRSDKFVAYIWLPGVAIVFFSGMLGLSTRTWFESLLSGSISLGFIAGGVDLIARATRCLLKRQYSGLILTVPFGAFLLLLGLNVLVNSMNTITEPAGGAYVSPAAGDPSAHP